MSKIILGFAGHIASGKDVCKKYLMEKYGAGSHRYSTVLRDILNRLYLPTDRNNLQNLSLDLRTRFGGDTLARVIIEDIIRDEREIIVIDGIRRLDDVTSLTKKFPDLHIIGIEVDAKTRYERLVKRDENIGDAAKTFEQFLADDQKEAELEIPTVMAAAEHKISNNGTLEELYAQIDQIISKIKK
ncbi:MAG: AAA family ATPase [Patescibacteria group bacterium]